MNWDTVTSKWDDYKGQLKSKWGKLTDDDVQAISGKFDVLVARLKQHYGLEKDAAEKEIDAFLEKLKPAGKQ